MIRIFRLKFPYFVVAAACTLWLENIFSYGGNFKGTSILVSDKSEWVGKCEGTLGLENVYTGDSTTSSLWKSILMIRDFDKGRHCSLLEAWTLHWPGRNSWNSSMRKLHKCLIIHLQSFGRRPTLASAPRSVWGELLRQHSSPRFWHRKPHKSPKIKRKIYISSLAQWNFRQTI